MSLPDYNYQEDSVLSPWDVSQAHSVNSLPQTYVTSEDLLAGQRLNRRMSNVRRFFCLFVTFDVLFTALLWIIGVMLTGEYIVTALMEQVVHYNIHNSLFDIVFLAMLRFCVLILFYAILYINHWIVVSISTTVTCAFLTGKVLLYDWLHSSHQGFDVVLVVVSFVLSWGEAWFLDYRVIPQEVNANRVFLGNIDPERAPLLSRHLQGLAFPPESTREYYSPQSSPSASVFEQPILSNKFPPVYFSATQEEEYKKAALEALILGKVMYVSQNWKKEKERNGDAVFIQNHADFGKVYKIIAQLDASPTTVFKEVFLNIHDLYKWNSSIEESHKIQDLDENTDICYQISTKAAKGMISSRDFVNLRHWSKVKNCYIASCVKTTHPSIPEFKEYIRGENGLVHYVIKPDETNAFKSVYVWMLSTNLKLKMTPKAVVEKAMIEMMFHHVEEFRKHLLNIK